MSTIRNIECKCPFCSKEFVETIQGSYTTFGLCLDSMPHGAAIVPNPIARCPECGFTEGNFFKEEDDKLLKEYLKEKKVNLNEPPYYSLAKEYEFLNKEDTLIAETYLKAFWESLNNYGYKDYDEKCIETLQKLAIDRMDKIKHTNHKYLKFQFIKLDLIRRLGEFDKGLSLIDEIKSIDILGLANLDDYSNEAKNDLKPSKSVIQEEINESSKYYQEKLNELLKIQEELIKNKDKDIHTLKKDLGETLFSHDGRGMFFL
ncbi:MAG: hypothetical protein FWH29_04970 [Methanobrevibacter sp.]|nr:hypothetical protein [Methanobrevibacter sp.]